MSDAEFLTVEEVAALLGRHPNSVRRYAIDGVIPGTRIGRAWCFLKEDLVACIRSEYSAPARMQPSAFQ